jgi:hypothetical protein
MWVVGLSLVVAMGGAYAAGFEGTVVTLADDTSMLVKLNVPHTEMKEALGAGGFAEPGGLLDGPGLRIQYYDNDLLLLLPVREATEVEVAGRRSRVMAALVLFPKPDGLEHRWPLVNQADRGVCFMVTVARPHKAVPTRTRLPQWGSVPGAMIGQGEVHPYVTQIGRGCVFGVGLVAGGRIVTCDLVR